MEKTTNHSPITQKHCATVKAPSAKDFRSRGYKMGFGPYSSTRLGYSRIGYYVLSINCTQPDTRVLQGHELALDSPDMCIIVCNYWHVSTKYRWLLMALSKEARTHVRRMQNAECSMLKLEPAGSMAYCTKPCCTTSYTLTNAFGEV